MSGAHHHPHAADIQDPARYQASRRVTLVSVGSNLVLTVAQIAVGIIGHSQALIADGMHTLSDLVTDAMVLFALKHGSKAADEEHPYGHGRIETATTMLLGGLLLVVGIGIAAGAGMRFVDPEPFVIPSSIALWVAIFTLAAKEWLYRYTIRVANRFDSNMLRANAWHHRSDAISSLIVLIGIGGALIGFGYMDAVAAIIVSIMVVKVGAELAWQALRELIDTGLSAEELNAIRHSIQSVAGVEALHMLRTRRVGGQALVDVHILVDPRLSVSEGHYISETVRGKVIHDIAPVTDVMVHIDTEEDLDAPEAAPLPGREDVLNRLAGYFTSIPQARHIERTTLHYGNGQIEAELILSRAVLADGTAAQDLTVAFNQAVRSDPYIRKVELYYH